jgi:RNase H-fold protein (predicted Holliday junction resolvase)
MLEGDVKRKKRKENIDMMAAQNILQSYMDSKNI